MEILVLSLYINTSYSSLLFIIMNIKHLSNSCFGNFKNNNKYSYSRTHSNIDSTYITIIFNVLIFNMNSKHYIILITFTDKYVLRY
jgi:hypothetical protein